MLHLPTNIKFIRELSGLTQQEFGELLGVNKDKIYNLENDRGKKDSVIIAKIADFAGVGEADLSTRRLTLKDVSETDLKRRINGNKKVPESGESDTYKDKYIALLEQRVKELEARSTPPPSTSAGTEGHLQKIRADMNYLMSLSVGYSKRALELQVQDKKKFLQEVRTIQQSVLADREQLLKQGTTFFEGTDGNSKS